jgi:hypothetical protein
LKREVETVIIVGQPKFVFHPDREDYHGRIEWFPGWEKAAPAHEKAVDPYPYVRFWDMRSALRVHDMLLGVDLPGILDESIAIRSARRGIARSRRRECLE